MAENFTYPSDYKINEIKLELERIGCEKPSSPSDIKIDDGEYLEDEKDKKCAKLFKELGQLLEQSSSLYDKYFGKSLFDEYGNPNDEYVKKMGPSIGPQQEDYSEKFDYIPPNQRDLFFGSPSKFLTPEYREHLRENFESLGITKNLQLAVGFFPIVGDILQAEECIKNIYILNDFYEKENVPEEVVSEMEKEVMVCLGLILVPGILESSLKFFIQKLRYGARAGKNADEMIKDSANHLLEEGKPLLESRDRINKQRRIENKTSPGTTVIGPRKAAKIRVGAGKHAQYFKDNIKQYADLVQDQGKTLLKEVDEVADFVLDRSKEITQYVAKKAEDTLTVIITPKSAGIYSGEDLLEDIIKAMETTADVAGVIRRQHRNIKATKDLAETYFCNIINTLNFNKHSEDD